LLQFSDFAEQKWNDICSNQTRSSRYKYIKNALTIRNAQIQLGSSQDPTWPLTGGRLAAKGKGAVKVVKGRQKGERQKREVGKHPFEINFWLRGVAYIVINCTFTQEGSLFPDYHGRRGV